MIMENESFVKGYKVFNSDWTCRGKRYTCPGKFEEDVNLSICHSGMHFCKKLIDCFNYYPFDPSNKVAEVIAYGNVVSERDKSCTDKLEIIRELDWHEVLDLVNVGTDNQGFRNTGSVNKGDDNTGWNNNGECNSGSFNTGNSNTGSFNIGDYNVGDFNKADYSCGCFCTEIPTNIYFFNKPSSWTYDDWYASAERNILLRMPKEESVRQDWWNDLDSFDRSIILNLPNFDADIFKEITGIDVCKEA